MYRQNGLHVPLKFNYNNLLITLTKVKDRWKGALARTCKFNCSWNSILLYFIQTISVTLIIWLYLNFFKKKKCHKNIGKIIVRVASLCIMKWLIDIILYNVIKDTSILFYGILICSKFIILFFSNLQISPFSLKRRRVFILTFLWKYCHSDCHLTNIAADNIFRLEEFYVVL